MQQAPDNNKNKVSSLIDMAKWPSMLPMEKRETGVGAVAAAAAGGGT